MALSSAGGNIFFVVLVYFYHVPLSAFLVRLPGWQLVKVV
jgi:hypothetical protein